MIGKLRPVGSRVPLPGKGDKLEFPWEAYYRTEFMGSGTEALSVALAITLRRKPEVLSPEVILPAYGCPDLIAATVAQGAKPVLVDLMPDCPFMSDTGIREAITPSTIAVVGAGFLGIPERLELLAEICRENGLFLIEDSAQCFPPASALNPLADFAILSFGRGKPINLMGTGALLIRNELFSISLDTLRSIPQKEWKPGPEWLIKRMIFNMLLAPFPYSILERIPLLAIGETRYNRLKRISRLKVPEGLLSSGVQALHLRPKTHLLYDVELGVISDLGWKCVFRNLLGELDPEGQHFMLRYPVLAPNKELRDRAVEALNSVGIGASTFYGQSLDQVDGVGHLLDTGDYPMARAFAARLFTLPAHEGVKKSDVSMAARALFALAIARAPL